MSDNLPFRAGCRNDGLANTLRPDLRDRDLDTTMLSTLPGQVNALDQTLDNIEAAVIESNIQTRERIYLSNTLDQRLVDFASVG